MSKHLTVVDKKFREIEEGAPVHRFRDQRISIPSSISNEVNVSDFYGETSSGKLVDVSRFGAKVVLTDIDNPLSTGVTMDSIQIKLGETIIFSGPAIIVFERKTTGSAPMIGLSLGGDGIDITQVLGIIDAQSDESQLNKVRDIVNDSQLVSTRFKELVADLNTLLQDLKTKLLVEDKRLVSISPSERHLERAREETVSLAISLYTAQIHSLFADFQNHIEGVPPNELPPYKRYFRANFHPNVLGAPFLERAFSKPLGYAGDYGLMVMLYEYFDEGGNLFERFMHRFSCNEPSAIANKNRVLLLSQFLEQVFDETALSHFKVTSVACGPAKEIEMFLTSPSISETKKDISIIGIDQDKSALNYAQPRIKKLIFNKKNIKAQFLEEDAVLGIIRNRPFVAEIRDSDVIFSAGLFDYLSDRISTKLISALFALLKKGGTLLIGNVSDNNPDKFSLAFFMEWNLILRTKTGLKSLVDQSIINNSNSEVEVISESLGLNLFLKITKK